MTLRANPYEKDLRAFLDAMKVGKSPSTTSTGMTYTEPIPMGASEDLPKESRKFWTLAGPVTMALDVLSRPFYGVGNIADAIVNPKIGQAGLPGQFWEGFSGKEKIHPGQVIAKGAGLEGTPAGVTGFILDVLLDPLNFVPLGIPGKIKRAREAKEAAALAPESTRTLGVEAEKAVEDIANVGTPTPTPTPTTPTPTTPTTPTTPSPTNAPVGPTGPVRAPGAVALDDEIAQLSKQYDTTPSAAEQERLGARLEELYAQRLAAQKVPPSTADLNAGGPLSSTGDINSEVARLSQLHDRTPNLAEQERIATKIEELYAQRLALRTQPKTSLKTDPRTFGTAAAVNKEIATLSERFDKSLNAAEKDALTEQITKLYERRLALQQGPIPSGERGIESAFTQVTPTNRAMDALLGPASATPVPALGTSPDKVSNFLDVLAPTARAIDTPTPAAPVVNIADEIKAADAKAASIKPEAEAPKKVASPFSDDLLKFLKVTALQVDSGATGEAFAKDFRTKLEDYVASAKPNNPRAVTLINDLKQYLASTEKAGSDIVSPKVAPVDDISKAAASEKIAAGDLKPVEKPLIPPALVEKVAKVLAATEKSAKAEKGHGNWAQAKGMVEAIRVMSEEVRAAALRGKPRQFRMREGVTEILTAIREGFLAKGLPSYITAGRGGVRYPLSDVDWLELLPAGLIDEVVFTAVRGIQPTQISAGIAKAFDMTGRGVSKADMLEEVRKVMGLSGAKGPNARHDFIEKVAKGILDTLPALVDRLATNRARLSVKHANDVVAITDDIITEVHKSLSTHSTAAVVNAVGDIINAVDNSAKKVGATAEAAADATVKVATEVEDIIGTTGLIAASTAEKVNKARLAGKSEEEIKKIVSDSAKKVEDQAKSTAAATTAAAANAATPPPAAAAAAAHAATPPPAAAAADTAKAAEDLAKETGETYAVGMYAVQDYLRHPFKHLKDTSKAKIMYRTFNDLLRGQGPSGLAGAEVAEYFKSLNQLDALGKDVALREFSLLRRGETSTNPEAAEIMTRLAGEIFEVSSKSGDLHGTFFRNGGTPDQLDELFEAYGLPYRFAMKEGEKIEDVAARWRTWPVEDPVQFLSQMYDTSRKLTAFQTVAITLENNFGSLVHKAGYVRIAAAKKSRIATHLNPKAYFPKEMAEVLDYLEYTSGLPRSFHGSKNFFGQLVDRGLDPTMAVWKSYMTIARFGHHPRNAASEVVLNHLAGMNNLPRWYTAAGKVLFGKGGADYKLRVGSTGETISGDHAYELFRKNGLRPNYQTQEDIFMAEGRNQSKIKSALLNNPYIKFMGNVSEVTATMGRFPQFLWEMSRAHPGAKNLEHAAAIAAAKVRKWHPDASGLGPKEAKYMRRIMPFYSWIRQAIPLVAEAAYTKPARLLAIPKASYNYAIANGAEPNSMSDPFTSEMYFPSFIRDNLLGPVNSSGTAYNFGTPLEGVADVFNPVNENPLTPVLDMLNPAFTAAFELPSGHMLDTGFPIKDTSEYIDNMIPVINSLSSISGYSVTGSMLGTLDPQRVVLQGNKEHWLNSNLLNYFTGVGQQNYAKNTYQKIGLNEARKEAREG